MENALEASGAGTSRSLGVLGEPGIGKSRLLAELARRATQRGHLVLTGRAAELERDVPFALWIDALDSRVADLPAEALAAIGDERLADLAVALPAVQPRVRRRAVGERGAPSRRARRARPARVARRACSQ